MAEVTGTIGDQQVELNNAATEATLKQLLIQTKLMAQKMGVSAAQQNKAEKQMAGFYKQLNKSNIGLKNSQKAREEEAKRIEAASKARAKEDALRERSAMVTNTFFKGLGAAADGLETFISKVGATMSAVANMGNSFAGAASVFNNIPIVGGLLGGIFGAIGGSADKVANSFRAVGQVGANFGGSISAMVNNASMAGLTMEQFGQMIQKNSEGLALLGGSTSEGAKRVVNFTQALKNSGVQDDLARLGFNAEDIANGMAGIAGRLARSGLTRGLSDAEITKVSGEYLKNLDAVSRLTGKNKEALQAEADARMADSQYRLMLAKLDPEGAANLEILMASIPKEHQAGLKEILATGTAVSDQARAAMYYMNKTGQNAMQLGSAMRASGTLTKEQMYAFDEARKEESKVLAAQAKEGRGVISTLGNYGTAVEQAMVVGSLNSAQEKTLRETRAQQEKEQAAQRKGQIDSLDPAALVAAQQSLAATSNQFTLMLANYLPQLMGAFNQLLSFIVTYVVPAFQFVMTHLKELVIAIVAVKVGMMALGAVVKTMEFINNFKNLGRTPGSKSNPMYTIDVGGPTRGRRVSPAKTTSKGGGLLDRLGQVDPRFEGLKGSKGLVRGLGAVGALASGAMLVSEMSDIKDQEKTGKITAAQATEMKGTAVGSAAGGAGGALAGAAAGAAIGSVIPVVGTVIGGLIGAGLGGWLGSEGGGIIGGEIAKGGFIEKAGAKITDAYKATTTFLGNGFTSIKEGLGDFAGSVKDKISETLPAIKEGFGKFTDGIGSMFNSMKDKFAETFPTVTEGLRKIADGVKKSAEFVADKAKAGANYVKGLFTPTGGGGVGGTPTAATATAPANTSTGINYGGKPEEVLRQFAKSQGVIKDPNKPATGTTTGSIETIEQRRAREAEAAKVKEDAEKKEREQRQQQNVPGQENPNTMLASLNKTMSEMVKSHKELITIGERQLSVQRKLSGDVFAV